MVVTVAVITLVVLLAFANGANDNSKGVATLVGFGAARPRQALLFAMVTTAVGAGFSFWFAGGLINAFKSGLFVPGTPLSSTFFIAVLVGAFGWVIFATRTGMPVSTTHAIIGGLLGAGLVAFGPHQIVWSLLAKSVGLPLLLSPVVSLLLVYLLAWPVGWLEGRTAGRCVCVMGETGAGICQAASVGAAGSASATVGAHGQIMQVVADTVSHCQQADAAVIATGSTISTGIHWLSSALVGFARGWNDAPKIAALSIMGLSAAGLPATLSPAALGFLIVTVAMALGGYLAGRKVLETLASKLTPLPLTESLTASMTTAALVASASWAGLPVSTTHVATGTIVGAGLKNNPSAVRWGKVGEIALSWAVTLPVAGLLAAGVMWCILALAGH
jgi:PiT family inorganic phosphate transporter